MIVISTANQVHALGMTESARALLRLSELEKDDAALRVYVQNNESPQKQDADEIDDPKPETNQTKGTQQQ